MVKYADRVAETTGTSGTGALSLGGAAVGGRTFADGFTSGDEVTYTVENAARTQWETGTGTYTTGSISRDTVSASSNGGALVDFGSGPKTVFATAGAALLNPVQALVSGDGIVYGAKKLNKFLAALGQAAYRRTNILYHSHSIGLGVDATSNGTYGATQFTDWHTKSQGAILAKILSAAVGGAACAANATMGGTGGVANPLFTYGGGMGTPVTGFFFGPVGWRAILSASAHTMAFTAVGSSIRVYSAASGNPSTVAARWKAPSVSAGATQTVAAAGTAPTPEADRTWYEFTISGVTPGETVTLMGPTSGSYSVYYVDLDYKPNTAGVTVHRVVQAGASLAQIHLAALDSTDTAAIDASLIGSGGTAVARRLQLAQSCTARMPADGVILQTDVNDLNDWTAYGYTLADMKRHLSNYLTYHAGLGLQVLVVCGPVRDPSYLPDTRPYDQDDLIAAYRAACAASTNAGFIDLTAEWPGDTLTARYDAQAAAGIMQDIVHPNAVGHGYYSQRIAQALLGAANRLAG